ncbi:tetratricopeptide repeat protein [Labrys sp. KNU-23]|nr:tetratricopeptide repeat protein [Labrys sp. KNU-23]
MSNMKMDVATTNISTTSSNDRVVPGPASWGQPGRRPAPSASELRNHLEAVRDAWQSSDWEGVIAAANDLLTLSPNHASVLKMRLRAAISAGLLDKVAQSAIAAADAHPSTAFIAAKKLLSGHQVESAAKVLVAIRHADAGDIDGFDEIAKRIASNLGKSAADLERGGDQEGYRRVLRLGIAVAPTDSTLRRRFSALRSDVVERAKQADFEHDPTGFVAAWEHVLNVDPEHPTAIKRLATAAERSGDATRALHLWTRLLEADPTDTKMVKRVARTAGQAEREYEGLAVLHQVGVASADGDYVPRLIHRVRRAGKLALRGGEARKAALHLALLAKVGQDDDELQVLRRKVSAVLSKELSAHRREKRPADAAEVAYLLLQIAPQNVPALTAVAHHLYQTHAFTDSANYYQRVLELKPDSATHWLHLARASHRAGDLATAASAVARSRELEPSNSASKNLQSLLDLNLAN